MVSTIRSLKMDIIDSKFVDNLEFLDEPITLTSVSYPFQYEVLVKKFKSEVAIAEARNALKNLLTQEELDPAATNKTIKKETRLELSDAMEELKVAFAEFENWP